MPYLRFPTPNTKKGLSAREALSFVYIIDMKTRNSSCITALLQ
nr:MAG TPA: hypothetical protein [Caudoviricetes sp.]